MPPGKRENVLPGNLKCAYEQPEEHATAQPEAGPWETLSVPPRNVKRALATRVVCSRATWECSGQPEECAPRHPQVCPKTTQSVFPTKRKRAPWQPESQAPEQPEDCSRTI